MPYANRTVAARYGGASRGGEFGGARAQGFNRGEAAPQQRFGSQGFEQRGYTENHSVFGGYHDGGMARSQSDRGFSSMGRSSGGFGGGGGFRGGGGGGGRR
jgi:CspA family cold shock protein